MNCANTQAELDHDYSLNNPAPCISSNQDVYGREETHYPPFDMEEKNRLIEAYNDAYNRLMAGHHIESGNGVNYWLPATLNNLQWVKELRKAMGDRGHSILYAHNNGELEECYSKMIREEASMLASMVVRNV